MFALRPTIQMNPFTHASSPFHTFPHACGSSSSHLGGFRVDPQTWKHVEEISDCGLPAAGSILQIGHSGNKKPLKQLKKGKQERTLPKHTCEDFKQHGRSHVIQRAGFKKARS